MYNAPPSYGTYATTLTVICPKCGSNLVADYESDTNSCCDAHCPDCGYEDMRGIE